MQSCPPESADITTDPQWQSEQSHRLLGFEILQQVLQAKTQVLTPTDIKERTGITRSYPSEVYRKVFLPRLLKKLGADNFEEALGAIRRLRDEIR